MVGHTLAKIFDIALDIYILTFTSIIKEDKENMHKVYHFLVNFNKVFDMIPQHLIIVYIEALGLHPLVVSFVMTFYETIFDKEHMEFGEIEEVQSNMGVKQGFLLYIILFGIYTDELWEIISKSLGTSNGCLRLRVSIFIHLFVDGIILMSHSLRDSKENLTS